MITDQMEPTMNQATVIRPQAANVPVAPLLFQKRAYVVEMDGQTTACISSTTSPVKEYTPDD